MKRLSRIKVILTGLLLTFAIAVPVAAQTIRSADDTILRQIIIFGRHSVRSPTAQPATLATYAVDWYPDDFEVAPGYLTPHGEEAELLLGSYFRAYLLHERLLTGDAGTDLAHSYFRANSIQRSNVTAAKFGAALLPGATIPVHSFPLGTSDPVFDPLGASVATVDPARAELEAQGIFGSGGALTSASSGERSLARSVLFDYPLGEQPPPATPSGKTDVASTPFSLSANTTELVTGNIINLGGLPSIIDATDPFVMEYTAGLPLEKVGWGRLPLDELSQLTRLITLEFSIAMRSPYLARAQSSNAASHILRTMEQAVIGEDILGAFGDARSRAIVIISSDAYLAGLAGLLGMHWALPGYQPDFCPPGGALVFELRQTRRSKDYLVRAYYTAQTFDQLRNLTPLTLEAPPATMQLLVPVEGQLATGSNLDVRFDLFQKLLRNAIDRKCVEDPLTEVPPGVLTVPPAVVNTRGNLIGRPNAISTLSTAQLDALAAAADLQELTGTARCDVTVAQINYQTIGVQPGEMTNASAAILIPSGAGCKGPFPLVAYSRGTQVEKAYALADPTNPETIRLMTFFAAQGYAVVATDFLGYALSDYPYHPYAHADSEASVVIDSIRAARRVAPSLGMRLNGKIMLTGYSQGGHSSMATQRAIEQENSGEFGLVAAAHLAGPYYISNALIDGVANPITGVQVFVPFEITSWQKVYGNVYNHTSDVFNAPYSTYIETLFPTLLDSAALAKLLPGGTPAEARDAMFVASYLNDLATNPNSATIIAAKKQDLLGWNPKVPTTLCGGLNDPTVKFSINAKAAYGDFRSRGGANVSLVDVDPEIALKYGSVLASNAPLYWKSYHGQYEPPFCSEVAKALFDLYK